MGMNGKKKKPTASLTTVVVYGLKRTITDAEIDMAIGPVAQWKHRSLITKTETSLEPDGTKTARIWCFRAGNTDSPGWQSWRLVLDALERMGYDRKKLKENSYHSDPRYAYPPPARNTNGSPRVGMSWKSRMGPSTKQILHD